MRPQPSKLIATLISEEIRRLVADAIAEGSVISTAQTADALMRSYPDCDVTEAEIANEVAWAACRAGVPIEFGQRGIAA